MCYTMLRTVAHHCVRIGNALHCQAMTCFLAVSKKLQDAFLYCHEHCSLTMDHIERHFGVLCHAEGSSVWQLRQLWCVPPVRGHGPGQRAEHVCEAAAVHPTERPAGELGLQAL